MRKKKKKKGKREREEGERNTRIQSFKEDREVQGAFGKIDGREDVVFG